MSLSDFELVYIQVQDIEQKLKQLQELNKDKLVSVTIDACLANCKLIEAVKNSAKQGIKLN